MERYYFNECFVCFSTHQLRKCSQCKIVSYCGAEHQKDNWNDHKNFCKSISKVLKSQNKSGIYENLDSSLWFEEKDKIIQQVETKLKRSLSAKEIFLFNFPVCFVCREINQEKLTSCSKCKTVSFCDIHSKSHIHDRNCLTGEKRNMDDVLVSDGFLANISYFEPILHACAAGTKILNLHQRRPVCSVDFFAFYIDSSTIKVDSLMLTTLSEYFNIHLTLLSVLQTLFSFIPSEIVIHIKIMDSVLRNAYPCCWETLLHLLPVTTNLKVVYLTKLNAPMKGLCIDCHSKGKCLSVEENLQLNGNEKPTSTKTLPCGCSLKGKCLSAKDNLQLKEKPTVIALCLLSLQNNFYQWLKTIDEVTSPVVITTSTESLHQEAEKEFLNATTSFRIIYSGFNEFGSLLFQDTLPNSKSFCRSSQFITIFQHEENIQNKYTIFEFSYYPQICHVCRKPEPTIICKRCEIISYCSSDHKRQDQIHHSDMCQVLCKLREEMSATTNVLYNSKTSDPDLWLRKRINILKNAHLRLERKLKKYEEEMFLFPKACGVCYDSELNLQECCKCGTFLCELHENDEKHKQVCGELSIAFKTYKSEAIVNVNFSLLKEASDEVSKTKKIDLMKIFVSMTFSLLQEISDKIFSGQIPASLKKLSTSSMDESPKEDNTFAKTIFIVNFLSAPLSMFHTMEKMNTKINLSMVIHVLGANREDFEEKFLWAFLFYDVAQMEDLKMIFIGPEFPNYPETQFDTSKLSGIKMNLKIEGYASDYDEYFSNEKFIKPDIIFGFNLNIHESKLATPEKTWKKTILTLEKVGVPFVLTSGTKKRAEKDHQTICELLEKNVAFEFFEKNPFTSLCPQRDFETGGVMYSNNYIVAYDGKFEISSNSTEEKEKKSEVDCEDSNSESKLEESETFLTERYKILSDENEKLKGQLDLANAKIGKQKNHILDLQKSFTDFVEKFKGKLDLANAEIEKQNSIDLKNSLKK